MKYFMILLLGLMTISCSDNSVQPPLPRSFIVVSVENEGISPVPDVEIEVMQTGEIRYTDNSGLAMFSEPTGKYDIRAFHITGPGPIGTRNLDFNVVIKQGQNTKIEVYECLYCP